MLRYFRSTEAILEQVRATLDAAWGFPNAETKTETALDPAASSPRDSQGRVYVVISWEYCGYEPAATMLPELIASGAVEEIDHAEYVLKFPLPAR